MSAADLSRRHWLAMACTTALAPGCAVLPGAWEGSRGQRLEAAAGADGWHPVLLPGKAPTRYSVTQKDGRWAVSARADSSASMLRRRVSVAPEQLGEARFSWWVESLPAGAHVADADQEDAAARVIFAFEGDLDKLTPRNRAMFDLARALTGEHPPYATLMYVWEAHQPLGAVVAHPRSDRIRKWVVDSGPEHLGTWRVHQRDLSADFERAFGEKPGALVAIGKMTDADNTRARAEAWYGPIELEP